MTSCMHIVFIAKGFMPKKNWINFSVPAIETGEGHSRDTESNM